MQYVQNQDAIVQSCSPWAKEEKKTETECDELQSRYALEYASHTVQDSLKHDRFLQELDHLFILVFGWQLIIGQLRWLSMLSITDWLGLHGLGINNLLLISLLLWCLILIFINQQCF